MENNISPNKRIQSNSSSIRGNNSADLLFYNRKLILNLIRRHSVISRIELSELSGLKPATITIIINEFISKGLVEDCGLIDGKNGRRVKGVRLFTSKYCTISVRITSSYYAIGLFDINSSCIAVEKISCDSYKNFYQTLVDVKRKINEFAALSSDYEILGVSLGLQSDFFIDYSDETAYFFSDTGNRIDIASFFEASCPYPVYIQRAVDFNAYRIYTANIIDNIEKKIVLTLNFSTSIDFSIIYHGDLYQGAYSSARCLQDIYIHSYDGTLKTVDETLSLHSVMEMAKSLLAEYPDSVLNTLKTFTYRDLINAFSSGDHLATEVFDRVADMLSQLILTMIRLFSPHCITIGDEIPPGDKFLQMVRTHLAQHGSSLFCSLTELVNVTYARATQFDAVLLGGNSFVIDAELPKRIT